MKKIICVVFMSVFLVCGTASAKTYITNKGHNVETMLVCEDGRLFMITIAETMIHGSVSVSTVQVLSTSFERGNGKPLKCK
jgi:hypothetical protein